MSRIVLEGNSDEVSEVVVGWDPPLSCWFAQVYGPEPSDDEEWEPFIWEFPITGKELLRIIDKYASSEDPKFEQVKASISAGVDPGSKRFVAEVPGPTIH